MFCHFGFLFMSLSVFLANYSAYSSIDVKDLAPLKCRIAGVVLVENEDRSKKFNYTMSESVCQKLGLQLASKVQVEKARRFGFETCSYGWVTEKFGVISRIQHNEKCGKNLTGVLTWSIPLSGSFNAYCFNESDTRINSCKPELMVTRPPSTVAAPSSSTLALTSLEPKTEPQTRSTAWRNLLTTPKDSSTRPLLITLMTSLRTSLKTTPPATTPSATTPPATTPSATTPPVTTPPVTTQGPTPTEELTNKPDSQVARNRLANKNEKVVFGGLPTALLILAIVFFIAAVVLAICYIRKYKTTLLFTRKKEEKESVETKVFKETTTTESTREEDKTPNGKQAADPQNSAVITGNCIEAEV